MDEAAEPGRGRRGDPGGARQRRRVRTDRRWATGSRSARDGICATASTSVDAALALVAGLITEDSEIVTVLVGVGGARRGHRARAGAGGAGALARGGRGARGWPAALPVPDRGGVATAPAHAARARRRRRWATSTGSPRSCSSGCALMTPPIESVLDLLQHYPRRYHDRTRKAEIAELVAGEEATIVAEVKRGLVAPDPAAQEDGRGRGRGRDRAC